MTVIVTMSSSNKFYILCEFVHENDTDSDEGFTTPLRIGYSEWIQSEEDKPPKLVDNLIADRDEVLLKWPKNYGVACKESMSKLKDIQ